MVVQLGHLVVRVAALDVALALSAGVRAGGADEGAVQLTKLLFTRDAR